MSEQQGTAAPSAAITAPATTPAPAPEAAAPAAQAAPAAPVTPPVVDEAKERESAKFAAIMKRERAAREAQKAAQAEKADLEGRIKAAQEEAIREYKQRLKQNPLGSLEEEGLTFDQLTQLAIGKGDEYKIKSFLDPLRKQYDEKISKLEEELKSYKTTNEKKEAELTYQTTIKTIKETLAEPGKYELSLAYGDSAVENIIATVQQHYQNQLDEGIERPKLLSWAEAADLVEKYYETEVEKYAANQKIQQIVSKKLAPKAPEEAPKAPSAPVASKTLTNSTQTEAPAPTNKPLTPRESLEAIKKQFSGSLFKTGV